MGIHLREARKRAGLTQAAVGEAIGRDQSTVSKYEAGEARVDPDVAPRLARVLGITVLEALYGDQDSADGDVSVNQADFQDSSEPLARAG